MRDIVLIAVTAFAVWIALAQWRRRLVLQRLEYIRSFEMPRGLFDRLRKRRSNLSLKDCQLVGHALRQFFLAYAMSGKRFVSMPSQVVDDLWHEFILYTRNYEAFCAQAFGGFMHHTPAVVLGSDHKANAGLRRCWWFACKEENINPERPARLPLLFAIDAKLDIEDGFRYAADCRSIRRVSHERRNDAVHCGGDFSSSSFDGGTDGFGDTGGDGSGCGGGGCGGGGGD